MTGTELVREVVRGCPWTASDPEGLEALGDAWEAYRAASATLHAVDIATDRDAWIRAADTALTAANVYATKADRLESHEWRGRNAPTRLAPDTASTSTRRDQGMTPRRCHTAGRVDARWESGSPSRRPRRSSAAYGGEAGPGQACLAGAADAFSQSGGLLCLGGGHLLGECLSEPVASAHAAYPVTLRLDRPTPTPRTYRGALGVRDGLEQLVQVDIPPSDRLLESHRQRLEQLLGLALAQLRHSAVPFAVD